MHGKHIRALIALLSLPLLLSLAACGNSPGQESAAEAFSTPSLWYESRFPAGSRVQISSILYFSGGKVTYYKASPGFTYSQVISKSRGEILAKAEEMDKEQFEENKKSDVASLEQIISTQKSIEEGAMIAARASNEPGNAAARESQIKAASESIKASEEGIENVRNAKWKSPSPVPYELSGSTLSFSAPESTGGLLAASCEQALSCSAVLRSPYEMKRFSFSLEPSLVVQTEGKAFSGFRVGIGSKATFLQTECREQFEI